MKSVFLSFLFVRILFLSNSLTAQPIPDGTRLKDILAGPRIGTVVGYGYGNTDPNGFIAGMYVNEIQTLFSREYNLGTVTLYPKWGGWPDSANTGRYNFTELNTLVNYMTANNKLLIMHMLCGPDIYLPDWFVKGNYNAMQQDSVLKEWIYKVMETNNNKEKVKIWNVVNEAVYYNGDYWPDSVVQFQKMGWEDDASGLAGADKINTRHPVYIRKAFEYAASKTNNVLELRDNSIETGDRKAKSFYQLVCHLLNTGVRIGAVGLQCHFELGKVDANLLQQEIKKYTSLGLQVYLTELDIANQENTPFDNAKAQQQKTDFYNVVKAATASGVSGINTWGITDGNEFWLTKQNALAFTEAFSAKPAYYGIQQALLDAQKKYDTIETASYILTAKHSGKVLDVKGADTANGATIWQYTRNNTAAQKWQVQHIQGGYHKITAACSGKSLDVGGAAADGVLLQQWQFGNADNQLWHFEKQQNGYYKITARHSGKVLTVAGSALTDEALVQQWRYVGSDNQLWLLEKITDSGIGTPNNIADVQFKLSPNPANAGLVSINYINPGSSGAAMIILTDLNGKKIRQKYCQLFTGNGVQNFNTKGIVPGMYIVQLVLQYTKKILTQKLLIE